MRLPKNKEEAILYRDIRAMLIQGMTEPDWYPPNKWSEKIADAFYAGAHGPRSNEDRFKLMRYLINNGLNPFGEKFKWIVLGYVSKGRVVMDWRGKTENHLKQVQRSSKSEKNWKPYSGGYDDLNDGRYYTKHHNT